MSDMPANSQAQGDEGRDHMSDAADHAKSAAGEAAGFAKDKAREYADRARNKASEYSGRAREAASEYAGRVREYADQGYHYAAEKGKVAKDTTEDYIQSNPWYAVGIALGVGVLVGLMVRGRD
jgi:ElaB/YqjD/DUF883 family membrane-anchored ribosome-binding protein